MKKFKFDKRILLILLLSLSFTTIFLTVDNSLAVAEDEIHVEKDDDDDSKYFLYEDKEGYSFYLCYMFHATKGKSIYTIISRVGHSSDAVYYRYWFRLEPEDNKWHYDFEYTDEESKEHVVDDETRKILGEKLFKDYVFPDVQKSTDKKKDNHVDNHVKGVIV